MHDYGPSCVGDAFLNVHSRRRLSLMPFGATIDCILGHGRDRRGVARRVPACHAPVVARLFFLLPCRRADERAGSTSPSFRALSCAPSSGRSASVVCEAVWASKGPRRGANVSIHAPARGGATTPRLMSQSPGPVSIHAPARGRHHCLIAHGNSGDGFDPRPARGAPPPILTVKRKAESFDPRPRTGGDAAGNVRLQGISCFDPRPRTRGDGLILSY